MVGHLWGDRTFLVILAESTAANPCTTARSRVNFSVIISITTRLGTSKFSVATFPNLSANYEQFSANFAAAQFRNRAERITLASRFTRDYTFSGTILRNLASRSHPHEKIRSTTRLIGYGGMAQIR